jgi:glucosamine--fructose-6-phosphate aminotransferase (isomerizing)
VTSSILRRHIDSLPTLVSSIARRQWDISQRLVASTQFDKIERIYVTGCGDSYHAAASSILAFEELTGIPSHAQSAMQLSRYSSSLISRSPADTILVLAISASGEVTRTIEALDVARKGGAAAIAVTANNESTLAVTADSVFSTETPPFAGESGDVVVPGSRSYFASLLSLFTFALAASLARGNISISKADELLYELEASAELIDRTIESNSPVVNEAAESWINEQEFVFCGTGPNYGTAMFSAAKLLEASGDQALSQDLEEWAHLQYFARKTRTPTIIISGGIRDQDRAGEIAVAARTIGRQVAVVAPSGSPLTGPSGDFHYRFPVASIRESFSPLVTCIPGLLFASERAALIGESYFRNFTGGRSREGGGGISRIRTSHRIDEQPSERIQGPME